jgi:hypothetical protein
MCGGEDCPFRNDCYRFTAKPSKGQSFFIDAPFDHKKYGCDFYIEDDKK